MCFIESWKECCRRCCCVFPFRKNERMPLLCNESFSSKSQESVTPTPHEHNETLSRPTVQVKATLNLQVLACLLLGALLPDDTPNLIILIEPFPKPWINHRDVLQKSKRDWLTKVRVVILGEEKDLIQEHRDQLPMIRSPPSTGEDQKEDEEEEKRDPFLGTSDLLLEHLSLLTFIPPADPHFRFLGKRRTASGRYPTARVELRQTNDLSQEILFQKIIYLWSDSFHFQHLEANLSSMLSLYSRQWSHPDTSYTSHVQIID